MRGLFLTHVPVCRPGRQAKTNIDAQQPDPPKNPACRRLLDQAPADDPDAAANAGCLLFKEGDYAGAAKKFEDATHALGRLVGLGIEHCLF
jgi:hypothetical protein